MKSIFVLNLIENQMNHFSPAEQVVADYVLNHPAEIMEMTTKQLAQASNGSEAAIIRFCKRIGINSFKGLKIEIAKEINVVPSDDKIDSPLQFDDNIVTVTSKVIDKTVLALKNTEKLLDSGELNRAIQAMNKAVKIHLYGAGGSFIVAQDLTQKLLRINLQAFQSQDVHVQMMLAANISPNDVMFIVSTSGKTTEVLKLMNIAKDKGATIILLTQYGKSPARKLADIVLTISEEEQNVRIGTMSARIAQLAVVDILFTGLAMEMGNSVYDRIFDTHKAVQNLKQK